MQDLATRFQAAADASKQLPTRPDNDTLLKIYALFKQASAGDVAGERPGMFDFVGQAKIRRVGRPEGHLEGRCDAVVCRADRAAERLSAPFSSRRTFLHLAGRALGVGTALGLGGDRVARAAARRPSLQHAPPLCAYVGCATTPERNGHGEGISVYRVDRASGAWTLVEVLRGEINPSFFAIDEARRCLFVTHSDTEQISAFRIDERSGRLALLSRESTGGNNPAHLALDPSRRFLVTANYGAGSVSVIPVLPDGRLGPRTALVPLEGALGPHRTEQATAHPHQCRFDRTGRVLAVPDKGLDRVFLFTLDAETGTLRPSTPPSVATRAGAGPRHVDFHPSGTHAYVVNELDSTVTTYRLDGAATWVPIQILPATPSSFTGANTGSAIEVSHAGRFVFVSNRGHDSIGTFEVDAATGTLSPVGWTPTQGRTPRFFCQDPSGAFLYVANQATDTIVPFRIEPRTGSLSQAGPPVATGTPMVIVFGAFA